jgi:hypothetical protein
MVHCALPLSGAFRATCDDPRFEIHAEPCAEVLARVSGLLARLDLLPTDLHARRSCGGMWIGATVEGDNIRAERAAAKLRTIIGVHSVLLIPAPTPAEPARPTVAETTRVPERIAEDAMA